MTAEESPLYALILAGGSGTRLWPYSRSHRPKQLLPLFGDQSMLADTVARLAPLVSPEHVFVLTNAAYVPDAREQLPAIPDAQIVGEPEALGTAAAVGLGTALVRAAAGAGATMFVLTADHLIAPADRFRRALERAAEVAAGVADGGRLVTFGIRPTHAETGYGYIELGDAIGSDAFQVIRFVEKPDRATAEAFVAGGRHLWNSGMFAWQVGAVWEAYSAFLPKLASHMTAIAELATAKGLGSPEFADGLAAIWGQIEDRTTVDYGIMEKSANVACLPADFTWSDIGSWAALAAALEADGDGNVVVGEHLGHDTRGSLIFAHGDRLVATIGVTDLIIVDTPDALLICPRDRAQEVKEMVSRLAELKREGLV